MIVRKPSFDLMTIIVVSDLRLTLYDVRDAIRTRANQLVRHSCNSDIEGKYAPRVCGRNEHNVYTDRNDNSDFDNRRRDLLALTIQRECFIRRFQGPRELIRAVYR